MSATTTPSLPESVWQMLGFDPVTLLMLAAGLLGGLVRAAATKDQSFFSKQTVVDAASSGIVGILLLAFGFLPGGWKPLWQAAMVAGLTYASSDVVQNVLRRLNIMTPPTGRRVTDRDA